MLAADRTEAADEAKRLACLGRERAMTSGEGAAAPRELGGALPGWMQSMTAAFAARARRQWLIGLEREGGEELSGVANRTAGSSILSL